MMFRLSNITTVLLTIRIHLIIVIEAKLNEGTQQYLADILPTKKVVLNRMKSSWSYTVKQERKEVELEEMMLYKSQPGFLTNIFCLWWIGGSVRERNIFKCTQEDESNEFCQNMVNLGETFPNFAVQTSTGDFHLYDFFQDSWGILFSHPADFTPVCTTELARVVQLKDEFAKRNCKVIALSCDSKESHLKWIKDIKVYAHSDEPDFPFPIIADENRDIAVELQMLDPDEKDSAGLALTARAVFIIDPKKKMRLSILYPATTGRNFDEILRVLDSIQLCDKYKVATPVDWQRGDEVIVQPTVSEEECKTSFPSITVVALPSGKNYVRKTTLSD